MIEGAPASKTIHGVAIAVGGSGLLILGDSGSGKSFLAAAMLAHWPFGTVHLVADDRVLLSRVGGAVIARPHPLIEGKLEIRGYGIVTAESLESVVVAGVIALSPTPLQRLPTPEEGSTEVLGVTLPTLHIVVESDPFARLITIWPYFSGQLREV